LRPSEGAALPGWLRGLLDDLPPGIQLGEPERIATAAGDRLAFWLRAGGRRLDGAVILLDRDPEGTLRVLRAPTGVPDPWALRPQATASAEEILAAASAWLAQRGIQPGARDRVALGDSLWALAPRTWRPVREVFVALRATAQDLRLLVDEATLEVVAAEDLARPATGLGIVFDPNPVVASGGQRPGLGDPLERWTVRRALPGLDGSGWLQGERVRVLTGRPPRAHREDLLYLYPPGEPGFEEVMAYYHLQRALAWVDSLGFLPPGTPVVAEVHAAAVDNSWYEPTTGTIRYGDGGVPDAQDADIILHELGHALHDRLVPGFYRGGALALSEGFSDYLACSLTGDPCLGEWDATGYGRSCLRRADDLRRYPEDLEGDPHADGTIWSGILWAVREAAGPAAADGLALASLARSGPRTGLEEAAALLAEAADTRGLGLLVRGILEERGLLPRSGDLALAPGEIFALAPAFPIPVGDSLAWGLEVGGGGVLALRSLPPEGGRSRGTVRLALRPVAAPGVSVSRCRLAYELEAEAVAIALDLEAAGGIVGSATVRVAPDGTVRLSWGGEGQGLDQPLEARLLVPDRTPVEIEAGRPWPPVVSGFVLRVPAGTSLSGSTLILEPAPGAEPAWSVRWETPPHPATPSRVRVAGSPSARPTVWFRIPPGSRGPVRASLLGPGGRLLRAWNAGGTAPGEYRLEVGGEGLASGIYWIRLEWPSGPERTVRVLLLH
jgi:hypothetical protein